MPPTIFLLKKAQQQILKSLLSTSGILPTEALYFEIFA